MSEVKITAGKIKGDYCEYSFSERTENGSQAVNISSEAIVHDDMRYAFRQLVPHLAFICDYLPVSTQLDIAMDDITKLQEESDLHTSLSVFKVTAFKLVGSGDAQGVSITGQKKLQNGSTLNITTPAVKYEDDYQYINELRIAVDKCQSEIVQYSDGKKAPDAQLEMFGDNDDMFEGEDL